MAISFVANALGATNSTTSFSITLPTTAANDIIVLEFTHRGTGDGTIGGTYSGPAFTLKKSQLYGVSLFSGKTYYSRATGNHSGQTVTGTGLTNSCAAIVTVYRGAITSGDPLADATVVGEENLSGDESNAQITTTTDGAWVVLVVVNSPDLDVNTQACTSPGTLTERAERLSTGGTDTSISHASAAKATAGATGALTWAQTNANSGSWAYAIRPQVSAALTGTITASVNEADIVAGGKTSIITLTNDKWIAAGAGSFDLQRDEIIAGFDSAQSEALGWDLVPKATQSLGGVVRTSDTVVTVTWDAFGTYNITAQETVTVTVPGTAVVNTVGVVATPTFTISHTVTGGGPLVNGCLVNGLLARGLTG